MRKLPEADPGEPDVRSATRYLWWVVRMQGSAIAGLVAFGIVWMVAQSLLPYTVGKAIDKIGAKDMSGLLTWTGMILALGLVVVFSGLARHRFAVTNWLSAAYRTIQVTGRQATRLGATLPKRLAAGEVVAVGNSDVSRIGSAIDVLGRGSGAVIAIFVVASIMLSTSVKLGLLVLVGVPLLLSLIGPLFRPLHRRQSAQRELYGGLTSRANDIVAGLRVLRGVGGEQAFNERYRAESQRVRHSGVRVGRVQSLLEAAQFLIPGVFLVVVTWVGARLALAGDVTPGQLVSFYGYAAFMVTPMRTLTEVADKMIKANVAAKRVVRILSLEPEIVSGGDAVLPTSGELHDPESGTVVGPGRLTAIAAATPEEAAAIADRLGRYTDSAATWGGVPLRDAPLAAVRERILVADNESLIFAGELRAELDPTGTADDATLDDALHVASAADIVEALPGGLTEDVAQRGRSFSGGQQQRLRLVRALLLDPDVLLLVEPTSAVDAHTEARIADRLRGAREGRTTVVCTTSPLMLDRADRVLYVEDGKVVAEGAHHELLKTEPRYLATVTRGEA
ncbi:ABC transporter [Longispora fulva]|uniref:ABC-type multidrug transport system fused ATPase/permease subunit n=1 Tax=Longispora fulva TaxID=619741 RepID=A0A8J7GZQ8_9ACTN|nr:ABC transporter ATP-binding protein [Longispora fulva]MBG6140143.1 ABC-type multidrug transport system fused ATPase/permease subunit [Longispora fulva]GIG57481.1 ABC transporter [Longispora fulva]